MFDKLVESDSAGAEFKNRSRYFTVSTIVVGILFLTAVVYSLYAAEIGLGPGGFEMAQLLAPVEMAEPEPQTEPDRRQSSPASASTERSDRLVRPVIMEKVETSTKAPVGFSMNPNRFEATDARDLNSVTIGPRSSGPGGSGQNPITGTATGPTNNTDVDDEISKTTPPQP